MLETPQEPIKYKKQKFSDHGLRIKQLDYTWMAIFQFRFDCRFTLSWLQTGEAVFFE